MLVIDFRSDPSPTSISCAENIILIEGSMALPDMTDIDELNDELLIQKTVLVKVPLTTRGITISNPLFLDKKMVKLLQEAKKRANEDDTSNTFPN